MKSGIELITQERKEQIEKHGRTVEKDVAQNKNNQLIHAAVYLLPYDCEDDISIGYTYPDGWEEIVFDRMMEKPEINRLIIAGALIAAEIDRRNQLSTK